MLERYGWSDALQHDFSPHAAQGLLPARVIIQQRGHYVVASESGEFTATLAGKFANEAQEGEYPVAGDWVAIAPREGVGAGLIRAVLPRRTKFVRKAAGPGAPRGQIVAANVDVALLTASLNADLSVRRIERYLASAWESGAQPVIVLTKADLCDDVAALKAEVEAVAFGVPVHAISSVSGEGLDDVRVHLQPQKTAVVLGSSGVGKSTLVNALAGRDLMVVREIRIGDETGKHTTTHRELIMLPNGALILDTPGMRELGLWDAEAGVSAAFGDIELLATQCRFHDCKHRTEPDCAILAGLADGSLPEDRWAAYGKLQRELRFEKNKTNAVSRSETRKVWIKRHKEGRARMKAKFGDD